ncbi:MAG: putative nucleic acid-binding Zn-ribbon protein [Patescibacteria group bacterium]
MIFNVPHQCVHCKKIIAVGSKEIVEGCADCQGHFFFYIRDEYVDKIREKALEVIPQLDTIDKRKVEDDVRNILNIMDEDVPVILDLESVRIPEPGKYELDLVSLMNQRPIIFKIEEGKYLIDIDGMVDI